MWKILKLFKNRENIILQYKVCKKNKEWAEVEKSWLNSEGGCCCVLNDNIQVFQVTFLGPGASLFVAAMVTTMASESAAWARCWAHLDSFSRDTHPLWWYLCWIFLAEKLTQWDTLCIDMWNIFLLWLGRLLKDFIFVFLEIFIFIGLYRESNCALWWPSSGLPLPEFFPNRQ